MTRPGPTPSHSTPVRAALRSVFAALRCVFAALRCVFAALRSVTALRCVFAALRSVFAALLSVSAALRAVRAALRGVRAALRSVFAALLSVTALVPVLSGCGSPKVAPLVAVTEGAGSEDPAENAALPQPDVSFAEDLSFLQAHTDIIVLESDDGQALVAVAPNYQGRVMTSSAEGAEGMSFGWLHRPAIERGERQPHMTVLGGEDRFWLGPEGGQYGLYFPEDALFTYENWQVPEPLDWGGWKVQEQYGNEVTFGRSMQLRNHSGANFSISVQRTVRLLDTAPLARKLGVADDSGIAVVGFESENTITNVGRTSWKRSHGLVSIWILGMFTPSPQTTVIIPFRPGEEQTLGPRVNDDYFGKIADDRLKVTDDTVFFRADGQRRGKIGIPRARALPIAGSYDATNQVLTLVQYTLPEDAQDYVDSRWIQQEHPYQGDVINSYNDGPAEPDTPPLGPFYEIETSSPVKELRPGESLTHIHRTIHLRGPEAALDTLAISHLQTSLPEVKATFAGE